MKDYGIAHSMERPITPDIKERKVFIAEHIEEEQVPIDDYNEDGERIERLVTGYKFRLIEYDKNEYIYLLQEQVTNTELALVELYEELI